MSDTGGKVLDHLPVFSDVTPCQFDSDLRHHGFRHENAPGSRGVSFWWGFRLVFLATFPRLQDGAFLPLDFDLNAVGAF